MKFWTPRLIDISNTSKGNPQPSLQSYSSMLKVTSPKRTSSFTNTTLYEPQQLTRCFVSELSFHSLFVPYQDKYIDSPAGGSSLADLQTNLIPTPIFSPRLAFVGIGSLVQTRTPRTAKMDAANAGAFGCLRRCSDRLIDQSAPPYIMQHTDNCGHASSWTSVSFTFLAGGPISSSASSLCFTVGGSLRGPIAEKASTSARALDSVSSLSISRASSRDRSVLGS
jgi:hypothetical protein